MSDRVLLLDGEQRSVLAATRGLAEAGYEVAVAAERRPVAAHWSRACSARFLLPDPWADPAVFALSLSHLVRRHDFSLLLPGTDASLLAISAFRAQLEPHIAMGLPSHDAVIRSLDKVTLIEQARAVGLDCPPSVVCTEHDEVLPAARAFGFPVVLKPVTSLVRTDALAWRQPGAALNNEAHLRARLYDFGLPLIVQRCETTTDVVSVAGVMIDGRLAAVACARYARTWPPASGSASLSVSIDPPASLVGQVEELVTRIGWEGIFELELLDLGDGTLSAIDLNPRLYGSLTLAIQSGANLPAVWCDSMLGRKPGFVAARGGERYRWEEGELRNALRHLTRGELSEIVDVVRPRPHTTHAYFRLSDPAPLAAWAALIPQRAIHYGEDGSAACEIGSPAEPVTQVPFERSLPEGTAEVITDLDALSAIVPEWTRLAEGLGNAFVSPDWFFAWLRTYGETADPYVTVLHRADGSVHSLLPFVRSRDRRRPTLAFAGANLGDYFQPVAPPGEAELAAAGAALALSRRRDEWGAVVLHNVDADTTWAEALRSAGGSGLAEVTHPREVLPYVAIDGLSWDEYLATRSRNFRGQLNRKLRRLGDEHEVSFRLTEDPARVADDMAIFFAFHDRRWENRGGSSVASERARAFHLDFAESALRSGALRLWFLEVDGDPVAAWYGWSFGRRYSYYLAGFDPAWSRHSVGLLLLAHTIKAAIAEGAHEYDLLRGDEDYKDRFATGHRYALTRIETPPLHSLRLAALIEIALRESGRRLPEGIRDQVRNASSVILAKLPGARER